MSNKFFQMPVPGAPWTGPSVAELQKAWNEEDAPYVGSNQKGHFLVPPKGKKGSLIPITTLSDESLDGQIGLAAVAVKEFEEQIAALQAKVAPARQSLAKLRQEKERRKQVEALKRREIELAKRREEKRREAEIRKRVEAQIRAEVIAAEKTPKEDTGRRFKDL